MRRQVETELCTLVILSYLRWAFHKNDPLCSQFTHGTLYHRYVWGLCLIHGCTVCSRIPRVSTVPLEGCVLGGCILG